MSSNIRMTSADRALGTDRDLARDSLARAESWLFSSGIYIQDQTNPDRGAVYAYFDCGKKRHETVYAEATGYLLSLLKYLHEKKGTPTLVEAARGSGDWLVKFAQGHDGLLLKGVSYGKVACEAYAFDNGICCKGLLDLYEISADPKYLRAAETLADWLATVALNEDGSVKPLFDMQSRRFLQDEAIWYKASGSFHAKIAMPLLQLYANNGSIALRDAALKLCRWAIGQQYPNGSFPANRAMRAVNLHAHCYTIEALMYAHALLDEQVFLEAAQKGVNWILTTQARHGHFRLWHGKNQMTMPASYSQAQVVRILALISMLDVNARQFTVRRNAIDALVRMQAIGNDIRMNGGFVEPAVWKYGLIPRKGAQITSWAAMFAIHALSLAEQLRSTTFPHEIRFLF